MPKLDMPPGKRLRRHSLAGYYNDANARDFGGEPMIARKQSQENNLRVVSPKPEGEVDTRLEAASAKIAEQEAEITKLRAHVQAAALKLEARTNQAASNAGDLGKFATLMKDPGQMQDQLSRASVPNSLGDSAPNQLQNNVILGVIQLTQTLQQRDNERKAAEQQVRNLEQQLSVWQSKYEESAALAQKLRTEIQTFHVSISKLEAGLKYSTEVETRLDAASAKIAEQGAEVTKLRAEVQTVALKLETHANEAGSNAGDLGQIQALEQELSQMRDQLKRANALNSLSGGSRRAIAKPVSTRLNSLVTLVQKNVRRRLAVKRYKELRSATIKIQTWWRGVMARTLVQKIREEVAARRLQTAARRFIQRKIFLDVHNAVVGLQSVIRGKNIRKNFKDTKLEVAATRLQSFFRGILTRRKYKANLHSVVWMQSHIRRRLARRVLKALSAAKQKEISYRLENKVVQLTQSLQQRDSERKAAEQQVRDLEQQLTIWQSKHEEAEARARKLQTDIQTLHVPTSKFEELLKSKTEVETRLEAASAKVAEQEAQITTVKLETRANEAASTAGDLGQIASLKQELSQMRDQLNRANVLNSLGGGSRRTAEPVSPTFQIGLEGYASHQQNGAPGLGASVATAGKRHQRPYSSAGHYNDASVRDSVDERMIAGKRSQANNPRAVSVAYNGLDGLPRYRNGPEEIYDDPGEERIRLLPDLDRLDAEVYEGLILGLKIPSPTSANAPSLKEVLFPANLISLISNEMWRYGMIGESKRFLANTMQTVQAHVMSFTGEDAIVPGVFWLSNVHEVHSFVCSAEADMMQGIGPTSESASYDWTTYQHLIQMVKSDLDSLEYNIYHSWMVETKKRLSKMIIPALIETQSLPGFIISEGAGRLFNRLLNQNTTPAYNVDDVLNLLNKVLKSLKSFFMEESVIQQVVTELLKLVGVTSFNDLLMRRNFCSWKRAMQIQNNIVRIEEWCNSHEMPEGTLQLEHLMQATKLLQLKKATQADIDIIYDVCWILTPSQIQRMCANYFVADYENPISPDILKLVAQRVQPNDKKDHLLLTPENEDVAPYELPLPREVAGLEHYVPAYLNVP
ncbi:Myosin type-2 heavy chain 1, partial [Ceratobasidium sp. 423]